MSHYDSGPGFVYVMHWNGLYKIGLSRHPEKRRRQLNSEYPGVSLEHTISVRWMAVCEQALHRHFRRHRRNGEWFELTSEQAEWLCSINSIDVDDIKALESDYWEEYRQMRARVDREQHERMRRRYWWWDEFFGKK